MADTPIMSAPDEIDENLEVKERLGKQLGVVKESLDQVVKGDANHWLAVASRTVAQQVKLLPSLMPDTITQAVKDCSISMTRGGLDGLIAYHLDSNLAGEPITNPQVRTCPLQEKRYAELVAAVIGGRAGPTDVSPTIQAGELVLLIDGGKLGNKRSLIKPWRPSSLKEEDDGDLEDDDVSATSQFKTRAVTVIKTEASIRARRTRAVARGAGSIPQVETMHICATDLSLPEQAWGHGYGGTNRGTAIAGISVDTLENDWTETVKTKKAIYGSSRVAVGNTDPAQPDMEVTLVFERVADYC